MHELGLSDDLPDIGAAGGGGTGQGLEADEVTGRPFEDWPLPAPQEAPDEDPRPVTPVDEAPVLPSPSVEDDGPGLGEALVALPALAVGALGGVAAGRLARPPSAPIAAQSTAPAAPTGSADEGPTAPPSGPSTIEAERETLVAACIEACDISAGHPAGERIERALAEIGVVAERPVNVRFDPARHRAVDRMPTREPALDGVVAQTERAGWRDKDRLLRRPEVIVLTAVPAGPADVAADA